MSGDSQVLVRAETSRNSQSGICGCTLTRIRPGSIGKKKFGSPYHHRALWTISAGLLGGVVAPVVVGLVLKALGLLHGVSLTTWLLDVGHNMGLPGAAGGVGAGAAGATGPGDSTPPNHKDPNPCASLQQEYDQQKAALDTIDAQQKALADAYNKSLPKLGALQDQFKNLQPSVQTLTRIGLAQTIYTAIASFCVDIVAATIAPQLEIEEAAAAGPSSVFDFVQSVTEIYDTIQAGSGNLEDRMESSHKASVRRVTWNKGKLVGQKAPLKQREIWAIRIRLQLAERTRELALFNLAVDTTSASKSMMLLRWPNRLRCSPEASGRLR